MVLAHEFSARMNLASPDDAAGWSVILRRLDCQPAWRILKVSCRRTDILMTHIAQDKKVRRGALTFILTRGIGQSFVADDVPADEVFRFLEDKRAS
jgi:3-dehydroquinate synthase